MNIDRKLLALCLLLGTGATGCAEHSIFESQSDSRFGEANRQTMMAQVIDPDPQYDEPALASGDHAAQAVERYRTDKVKQPDTIRTTSGGSSATPN